MKQDKDMLRREAELERVQEMMDAKQDADREAIRNEMLDRMRIKAVGDDLCDRQSFADMVLCEFVRAGTPSGGSWIDIARTKSLFYDAVWEEIETHIEYWIDQELNDRE